MTRWQTLIASMVLVASFACERGTGQVQLPPPRVGVVRTLSATVAGEGRFVGTIQAVQRVELRSRIQGTLEEKYFVDGDRVTKGQKLFQIDPRSPRAALAETRAGLANSQANLQKAVADARRARNLYEANSISKAELDTALANERAAKAAVSASRAVVESASLDTQYTVITAPFDGRIGQTTVNVGNLVSPSMTTPLATVVKIDPIYVDFTISEREYLRSRPSATEDTPPDSLDVLVALELADGSIYEYAGQLVFLSPELDASTGTFTVRAIFPNPYSILRPGQFAKVILRSRQAKDKVLVPEDAVVTKQTGSTVFVVDGTTVEERLIQTGDRRGRLRIVESGLSGGEVIVAQGVHKVRDGATIEPKELPPVDLSSDPLAVAPPEVLPGDWYRDYLPRNLGPDASKER